MEIVRVIPVGIIAGRVSAGQILLIDVGCLLISFGRFMVLPEPHVNVGGHMHEMPGTRHQVRQSLCTGQGPFRLR